jgi:hypothetical protein
VELRPLALAERGGEASEAGEEERGVVEADVLPFGVTAGICRGVTLPELADELDAAAVGACWIFRRMRQRGGGGRRCSDRRTGRERKKESTRTPW